MSSSINNSNLRIVFMGTPEFAVASLDILVKNGYTIAGVVTAPDKPAGRGLELQESEVKKYSLSKGLKILQPANLKDKIFLDELKDLKADLQVVVAFRMLPPEVWKMPGLGTFNLHASLLPQYRGAGPINHAIINGETETGVTTFFLKQEIDTGEIIFRERVLINNTENAGELHDKLMDVGAGLVLKTVKAIEKNEVVPFPQDKFFKAGVLLHPAPKIFKEDCRINWTKDISVVHDLIRGLSPYPSAFTSFTNADNEAVNIKIFRAEKQVSDHRELPGKIFTDGKEILRISVRGGYIRIAEIQQAGKKRMPVKEFLRGFRFDKKLAAG